MNSWVNNQNYLLNDQYKTASKLNARVNLHKRFSTNRYGWMRWVFDELTDLPPNAHLLEVGCGSGYLWAENQDRIPAGWTITLSDFSPGMLEEIQHDLAKVKHAFTFENFDVQSIPHEDGSFDAVIGNHMLPHVPDRRKAISEIRRVLKKGGTAFLATNGVTHLRELYELEARFCQENGLTYKPSGIKGTFELENGYNQLAPFFREVRVKRYEDALMVTEVEPLVAYILSMMNAQGLEQHVDALRAFLRREMEYTGALRISKDGGMFIACC